MAMKVLRSKWPNRSITCLTLCALINSTVYVIAYKTRPIWFLFGTLLCITVIRPKQLLNNCHEIKLEDLSKDPWHLTFGYHLVCYPWIAAFFSKTKIFNKKTRLDMIIIPYIFTLLSKSFRSMQFRFGFCFLENMFVWAKKREMFVIFILLLSCSCFTILWPFRIRNIHSFNDFEYLRRKFGVLSTIQAAARL